MISREIAWLSGDASVVQRVGTIQPPHPARTKIRAAMLWRESVIERPWATGRRMRTYSLVLTLRWPLATAGGTVDRDIAALDAAVESLLTRIRGPLGDSSHGGAFLSAAESDIRVDYPDLVGAAEDTTRPLRVDIRYSVDEEVTG